MHILSVNRGKVAPLFVSESGVTQSVISGIRKQAVDSPVQIGILGMEGDEQADLTTQLAPGAMGENLTTIGIMEHDLWVGDRLKIGEVLLEVTEPRAPCYKFAARMGFRHAVKHMLQSGFTGVYLKVKQQGSIQAKSTITLLPGPREVSIADINGRRLKGRQRDLFP